MLKCEMCLGRTLRGEMSVLRSVDRSIEYEAGTAIEITDDTHRINVKVDGITVKLNSNGSLTVDIPDIYAVTAILETLSRYPLDHNYHDLRPLVPNGVNQGKWATETVGANNNPIFMNQGVISASDASIGAANKPIHMENGVIKASGANVGSTSKPMYMNSGVLTPCGNSLDVSVTGNAANDALGQKIDETYLKAISVGADGTITVTRGDGQNTSYTSLKDFVDDITQNYVKRTPTDLISNPMFFDNDGVTYNRVTSGNYSGNTTYYYKNGSNYEVINFTAVPCNGLSYDSTKTYYKFNYSTDDYEVFAATTLNFTTNRDELFYIYDSRHSKTYEELLADNVLYIATVSAGSSTWYSDNAFKDPQNNPLPIPHSGVMTITSRFETEISVKDLTLNRTLGWVDRKHKYGTGRETMTVMVIKGHRYSVEGYDLISIGFFGD